MRRTDYVIAMYQDGKDRIEYQQPHCSNCNRVIGDRRQECLIARVEDK